MKSNAIPKFASDGGDFRGEVKDDDQVPLKTEFLTETRMTDLGVLLSMKSRARDRLERRTRAGTPEDLGKP
jgi:hypothetical protein